MNARSHYTALSLPPAPFTSASSTRYPLPFLRSAFCIQTTGSCPHKQLRISNTAYFKFPRSFFPEAPHLSDDEDEGGGGGDDHDEDEENTAAEEYEVELAEALGEVEVGDDEIEGSVAASEAAPRLKELKWQRVEKCRNEVREFGEEIIDVDELASIYDFRIDKFQRLAMEAFLRGSSVVVSAPTSSGKTLIAEAAAVATVSRGRRLFYTTPLKALSNQKFREFRETFGDSSVGLLTGDSAVNKDAQILIMTTEILRNMLYQSIGMVSSSSGLFHVDVIVLDEVHYLSDISRGTVWEEIIIYCPRELQLICLSATVANPDELAGWIGQIHGKTELVASSKRPVQLNWHFVTKIAMLPLLDKKGTSMNRKVSLNYLQHQDSGVTFNKDSGYRRKNAKRDFELSYSHQDEKSRLSKNEINTLRRSQAPQVKDVLWHLKKREMLPAIWFIFSRKGCDAAVQYLEDCNLLDECEKSEVELALMRFRVQHPDAVRNSALKGLLHGVAAHHAGCLPLWKSFIEVLFQRGLVKIVFATETLAAGMNMPARTAVIASISRRNESGHVKLSPNQLLQMAGRAGRRGIDERGHVVLLQTPYDGAEQYSKLFFAGVEPLVSQFTASYGMVLNLLAGSKVIQRLSGSNEIKIHKAGRTLEEARKLIERSFGNYVGTNVMVSLKEELTKIQKEIEFLTMGVTDDAVDMKIRKQLSKKAYNEITDLHKEFEAGKYLRTEMWRRMESKRVSALKPLLKDLEHGHLPFICLQYADKNGIENTIPAVYLGKAHSLYGSTAKEMVDTNGPFIINDLKTEHDGDDTGHQQDIEISFYVALGSDNTWYLFSEKWIKKIYQTSLPNSALGEGDPLPREIMWKLLDKEDMLWEKLADSELGGLWGMDGSLETWSWSLNVPVLSSLLEEDEMFPTSQEYLAVVECYKEQRNKVSRIKKKITRTEGFKEYKKIIDMTKLTEENIRHLQVRSNRLIGRLEQIEPSGWKDFLQISGVIHECRALDINTQVIFPLGETAAAIRGENELWLAMVLRNKILLDLRPEQLAAVCGSLVSEGIKVRPSKNNSYIYEPSTTVFNIIRLLEEQRRSLSDIQEKHGVNIPCGLDSQFCGMVEAWASGISWREVMMDCAMDEGDLARLLRRTTDLLAQIPKLPDIDSRLQRCALTASDVMDRSPISELVG